MALRRDHLPSDAYRGPDRRARPAADHRLTVVWAGLVAATPFVAYPLAPGAAHAATQAATVALTLGLFVGLLAGVTRRAVGDHRMGAAGAALLAMALGPVAVAAQTAALVDSPVPHALVVALPAFVLFALAPFGPTIDTRGRASWGAVAVVGVLSAVIALALATTSLRSLVAAPGFGQPRWLSSSGLGVLAVVAALVAVVYLARARREDSELLSTMALVPLAGSVAAAVAALGLPSAGFVAWVTLAVGLAGALVGVVRAVLRAHRTERRRVLAALTDVERLQASQQTSLLDRAQLHDLRSGLLVLEGAVAQIAGADSDAELIAAVRAEVARLRGLMEPASSAAPARPYDLREALAPVVRCAQAAGLPVQVQVDDSFVVPGDPTVTARVVHGLLANARRHAPGAPVAVACERDGDEVVVRVADDGPGLDPVVRDRLFEPGARSGTSEGEGIGLASSRRLARSQRGDLRVVERADGVTFELRLPADTRGAA